MNDMPSGISILPSIPVRKNSGIKLAIIIREELNIGILTSFDALNTTFKTGRRSASGSNRFSLRRLYTFSTSTMASSTSDPIAIAIPPRLIVLIVIPSRFNISTVIIIDNGSVTMEIIVVRAFIKKKNSTIITISAPSKRACCKFVIELFIKCA